ncbi:hypothetical protein [Winogradskyella sp.]|uniref:hypothetical protein n=1 Tax=Winogradskyella sp. TaxID=1883156 RepID=UPI0035126866
MTKKFLFISCEEAQHICDKRQYGEATTWERITLALRLSWCRITRAYSSKNNKLTQALQKAEVDYLRHDERTQLQKRFEEELRKYQQ